MKAAVLVAALALGCRQVAGDQSVVPLAEVPHVPPPASASSPTPSPSVAQATGTSPASSSSAAKTTPAPASTVRYWRRVPAPEDSSFTRVTLNDHELTLLSTESERVLTVVSRQISGPVTTLSVRSPGGGAWCSLDDSVPGRTVFACVGESERYVLTELQSSVDGEEISRIEAEIRALTPPADACARAERCCKAATPLLEPGEVCNVGFQLGPDYFPDHCQKTYKAFQTLLEAKHLKTPQDCRAP